MSCVPWAWCYFCLLPASISSLSLFSLHAQSLSVSHYKPFFIESTDSVKFSKILLSPVTSSSLVISSLELSRTVLDSNCMRTFVDGSYWLWWSFSLKAEHTGNSATNSCSTVQMRGCKPNISSLSPLIFLNAHSPPSSPHRRSELCSTVLRPPQGTWRDSRCASPLTCTAATLFFFVFCFVFPSCISLFSPTVHLVLRCKILQHNQPMV